MLLTTPVGLSPPQSTKADDKTPTSQQPNGVHLPGARQASRSLDLADELIAERRFSEAIPLLLRLLDAEQDRAYGVRFESQTGFSSLKRRAADALDKLDERGRDAYELAIAAATQRELRRAVAAGDRPALESLTRRYPSSSSSAAACWELARIAADQSEHERALAWINKLRSHTQAATGYEPQASLLEALSHTALGDTTAAESTLRKLKVRLPAANGGTPPIDALLATITNRRLSPASGEQDAWLGVGGDRRRAKPLAGDPPRLWARWRARTAPTTDQSAFVHAQGLARQREGRPTVLAASPVAVGDQVIARAGDRVVAIDWRTGRRRWQTRPVGDDRDKRAEGFRVSGGGEVLRVFGRTGADRGSDAEHAADLWLNTLSRGLSSDGRLVFAVHEAPSEGGSRAAWQAPFGRFNRRGRSAPATNHLAAYDPRLEGKLVWKADGANDDGEWAGSCFLGAPLAVDGRLLALLEHDQTITLAEIDPSAGAPIWRQPLATVELSINESPVRRQTGAVVAAADEVAVCSTGTGVVVAVDLTDRTLKWVHRLPVKAGRHVRTGAFAGRRHDRAAAEDSRRRWLHNQIAIAAGKVIVAAPESDQLRALDLATGELAWSEPRNDAVLLGPVGPDFVTVVEAQAVTALKTETGAREWRRRAPANRTLVGAGLRVDDKLILPLNDGDLFVADSNTGEASVLEVWEGAAGSLIYHRGGFVSQTAGSVDRFDPPRLLITEKTSSDERRVLLEALRTGERLLEQGEWDEAVAMLQQARASATSVGPDGRLVDDRLRRALRAATRARAATDAELQLMLELATTDEERLEVAAQGARLAAAWGDASGVARYANIVAAARPSRATPVAVADGHWALPERQVGGAIADVWATLSVDEKETAFADLLEPTGNRLGLIDSERVTQLIDALPGDDDRHAALATAWRSRGEAARALRHTAAAPTADLTEERAVSSPTSWSFRQAVSVTKPRRGSSARRGRSKQDPLVGYFNLPVEEPYRRGPPTTVYGLSKSTLLLTAWDRQGGRLFRVKVPEVGGDIARRLGSATAASPYASPVAWRVAGQVVLSGGGDVIGIDANAAEEGAEPSVWRARQTMSAFAEDRRVDAPLANLSATQRPQPSAFTRRDRWTAAGATAAGVLIHNPTSLALLDLLTGEPQWVRTDLDLRDAEILVGERHAYARVRGGGTLSIRLLDGRVDREWRGPPGEWIALRNGRLIAVERDGAALHLTATDPSTGETTLSEHFADATLARVRHSHDLLVASPTADGVELTLIDGDRATLLPRTIIPGTPAPETVTAWRRPFGLVVALSRPAKKRLPTLDALPIESGPLLNGPLVCLSDNGRLVWRAEVSSHEWVDRTPVGSPLVVLGRRDHRHSPASARVTSQLIVIDGATGRSVASIDDLEEDSPAVFHLRHRPGPSPSLVASFQRTDTRLRLTESPLPPGPAYRASVESPSALTLADLWNASQQFGQAIGDAFRAKPPQKEEGGD